ncbi:MAG: peptidoglycan-binding protein [Rivularia sp. (in: Bacteria)]|nr:peptidoglycan-binding protein [Rivularia sp. MS3]
MIGSKKLSIIKYLRSLISFRFLPRNKFYWLLLISSSPLFFGVSARVSIAAPQKIAQVVVGATINRPTLKIGSEGVPVRELQGALKLLGFYKGEVNGIFSQSTKKAVSSFQQAAGLKSDGVVDTNTWQTLFPSTSTSTASTTSTKVTAATTPPPSDTFPMPTESFSSVRVVNNSTQQRTVTTAVNNSPVRIVQPAAPEPKPSTPAATNPEPTPAKPKPQTTTRKRKPARRQAATTRTRQTTTNRRSTTTKKKPPVVQYTAAGFPILRPGMRGSQVVKLQEKLSNLGLLKGVDGDFGPVTLEAVKAFQKRNGLEPDGVVGGATWNLLDKR